MLFTFRLFVFSILLCLISSSLRAGGGDEWNSSFFVDKGFNILHEGLVTTSVRRSSSMSPHNFNGKESDEERATKKYNLLSWSKYLKTTPIIAERIVYDNDSSIEVSSSVKRYLDIVHQQEDTVSSGIPYWLDDAEKKSKLLELQINRDKYIEIVTAQLQTETDPFLKQRYIYLLVRLQHYSDRYEDVVSLYEKYKKDIQQPTEEVTHWINLLHAGALQHLGERAKSAYIFATTFRETKTKHLQSQINFRITTDEEWQDLLKLCKNDDEKALMHFMRAIRNNANSFQELEVIYKMAPNSTWFDNLLIRELEFVQFSKTPSLGANGLWLININKEVLIDSSSLSVFDEEQEFTEKQRRTEYLTQLSQFVALVLQEKKRTDLFLSHYASLYLRLLSEEPIDLFDIQAYKQHYAQDSRLLFTKGLELFVYLENLEEINETSEKIISDQLIEIKALDKEDNLSLDGNIMTYTYIKLAPLYLKANQPGKYYFAKNRGRINEDEILVGEIRGLLKLRKLDSPNFLEKRMINR